MSVGQKQKKVCVIFADETQMSSVEIRVTYNRG